jgi:hypothetical protein
MPDRDAVAVEDIGIAGHPIQRVDIAAGHYPQPLVGAQSSVVLQSVAPGEQQRKFAGGGTRHRGDELLAIARQDVFRQPVVGLRDLGQRAIGAVQVAPGQVFEREVGNQQQPAHHADHQRGIGDDQFRAQ